MANEIKVDLDSFNQLPTADAKLKAIFLNTSFLINQNEDCRKRVEILENQKKRNLISAGGSGGIVAGIIVIIDYLWIKMTGGGT